MPTSRPLPHRGPFQLLASGGLARVVLAAAVAAVAGMTACGAPTIQAENDLFREASLALEEESYTTAIASYKKLLEEYPFSDKAEVASLNIAYAHYLKEEYGEAIAAFNDFERQHPVSPLLPFVSYTIGMCWLDQARAGDRDAGPSEEALRQFRKVATEFPRTLYADLANFRQQQARENLAAHEIVVGDYYRDRQRFEAAMSRYRYAIREYPGTQSALRAEARLRDIEAMAKAEALEPPKPPEAVAAEQEAPSTAPPTAPAAPVVTPADDGATP